MKYIYISLIVITCIGMAFAGKRIEVKNIFFERNFNDGDLTGLSFQGNLTTGIINNTLQVILNYTDPVPYRTEVRVNGNDEINNVYWYGLKVYIPEEWENDSEPEIIMQWHGYPDFHLGETWRNPMISLHVKDDEYVLKVKGDSREVTVEPYEFKKAFNLGRIDRGRWMDWIFRIDWNYLDGKITIWKDQEKVKVIRGANCYNDEVGPYYKFGIYKFPWKNGPSNVDSRELYYDDLRIGRN